MLQNYLTLFQKLKNLYSELKNKSGSSTVPSCPPGYELIEVTKLEQLACQLNEGNRKLQEKCEQYNALKSQQNKKEALMLEKNSSLELKYSKSCMDLDVCLQEIVNLKSTIEELQTELSKNANSNTVDTKISLDKKCDTSKKTKEPLNKSECDAGGVLDKTGDNVKLESNDNKQKVNFPLLS